MNTVYKPIINSEEGILKGHSGSLSKIIWFRKEEKKITENKEIVFVIVHHTLIPLSTN